MDDLLNWLARTLHVLGAALWVGGYAALLTLVVPAPARDRGEARSDGARCDRRERCGNRQRCGSGTARDYHGRDLCEPASGAGITGPCSGACPSRVRSHAALTSSPARRPRPCGLAPETVHPHSAAAIHPTPPSMVDRDQPER